MFRCRNGFLATVSCVQAALQVGAAPEPPVSPAVPAGQRAGAYTTQLEHMDTLHQMLHQDVGLSRKYSDLDLAEEELGTYCSRLGAEADMEKCWQVRLCECTAVALACFQHQQVQNRQHMQRQHGAAMSGG